MPISREPGSGSAFVIIPNALIDLDTVVIVYPVIFKLLPDIPNTVAVASIIDCKLAASNVKFPLPSNTTLVTVTPIVKSKAIVSPKFI